MRGLLYFSVIVFFSRLLLILNHQLLVLSVVRKKTGEEESTPDSGPGSASCPGCPSAIFVSGGDCAGSLRGVLSVPLSPFAD